MKDNNYVDDDRPYTVHIAAPLKVKAAVYEFALNAAIKLFGRNVTLKFANVACVRGPEDPCYNKERLAQLNEQLQVKFGPPFVWCDSFPDMPIHPETALEMVRMKDPLTLVYTESGDEGLLIHWSATHQFDTRIPLPGFIEKDNGVCFPGMFLWKRDLDRCQLPTAIPETKQALWARLSCGNLYFEGKTIYAMVTINESGGCNCYVVYAESYPPVMKTVTELDQDAIHFVIGQEVAPFLTDDWVPVNL